MLLESFKHAESSFITLTYDPEHLPDGGSLVPKHMQDWLKRVRKTFYPRRLRYFGVGEYGDETFRPHYHVALFGVSALSIAGVDGRSDPLRRLWGMGHVYAGELNWHSAQYIGGYVAKKMTKGDDPRLRGRYPEFARMSLRPGIGAFAMVDVAHALFSSSADVVGAAGDVPSVLQHGMKKFPLGRYLRRRLRLELGFASADPPKDSLKGYALEMRRVFETAISSPEGPTEGLKYLQQVNEQKIRNMVARYKIHNKRGAL